METVEAVWTHKRDNIRRYSCAIETVQRLENTAENTDGSLVLDLTDVEWISCIYSAPLATGIQKIRNKGTDIQIRYPSKHSVSKYLHTIQFPKGTTDDKSITSTYLPLIQLNTPGQRSVIDTAGETLRHLIDQLISDIDNVSIDPIYLPIGELLDNVDQHSRCDYGFATVQYYPKKDRLDFCIVDDGITIPGNYEEYEIDFETDLGAVKQALTKGLSTKTEDDPMGRSRGTGLRTTANIICDGLSGELLVSSRRGTIHKRDGINEIDHCYWDGTVIFGRLNVPKSNFDYTQYIAI